MPCSLGGLRGCGGDAHHVHLLKPVPGDTSKLKQTSENQRHLPNSHPHTPTTTGQCWVVWVGEGHGVIVHSPSRVNTALPPLLLSKHPSRPVTHQQDNPKNDHASLPRAPPGAPAHRTGHPPDSSPARADCPEMPRRWSIPHGLTPGAVAAFPQSVGGSRQTQPGDMRRAWRGPKGRRKDQDQAVPRPSDVKSRRDTTGQNENKPAGQG
jgi:hypothetical protein